MKISSSSTCPPATAREVGDSAGAIRRTLSARKNPQSFEQFLGTSSFSFTPSIRRKAGLKQCGAVPINHQQPVTHTGDDQTQEFGLLDQRFIGRAQDGRTRKIYRL